MKVKFLGSLDYVTSRSLKAGDIYEVEKCNVGGWVKTQNGFILLPDEYEQINKSTDSTKDPIVQRVIDQFQERSRIGIETYGKTLERNDLNTLQWLTHLQEELMDATLYIERLKQEYETRD